MIETLEDAIGRVQDLGIEYMITGSVAMSAYATARTTMDIDVIIELRALDAARFESKFIDDYYVDAASIEDARARQSMFNVFNLRTGVKVDFIIRKQNVLEVEKFGRRRHSKIGNNDYWVINKEDLILSKLNWAKDSHSEMQFRDIRNLLESGADEGFIMRTIARHGLSEVWNTFNEWKIRIEK